MIQDIPLLAWLFIWPLILFFISFCGNCFL